MDLYEILGVGKNATGEEIKDSYRKKASKLHPDKEGGDKERFQKLQHAYEVLSDQSRRKTYDDSGETKEVDKRHEILGAVVGLMRQVIEKSSSPEKEDLLEIVKNHIIAAKHNISVDEKRVRLHKVKYEKLRKRFNRKGDGENLFEALIESTIRDDERALERFKDKKEELTVMLSMLDDFSFQKEVVTAVYSTSDVSIHYFPN